MRVHFVIIISAIKFIQQRLTEMCYPPHTLYILTVGGNGFNKVITMDKQEKHLGSVDEDIDDVLRLIEKSYDIKFEGNELEHIRTFGQLTDHIISKIKLEDKNDCTDQQAFYRLRTAIETIKSVDKSVVGPKTQLTKIFPRQKRRMEIKQIESELKLDLKALKPRPIVTNSLIIILALSAVGLFIKWQFGLTGLLFSVGGLWISEKTGKEFKDKTLGELTDRMTQLNYSKSRRQTGTMNVKEIQGKIEKLFVDNLGLETRTIDRDTVIITETPLLYKRSSRTHSHQHQI